MRAPYPGELFKNPALANTFRLLASIGKEGFYEGPVAQAMIEVVQYAGGYLDIKDLVDHMNIGSEEVEPISIKFNGQDMARVPSHVGAEIDEQEGNEGVEVWECPPNGQGIVALMALGILEELEKTGMIRQFKEGDHNCAE